MNVIVLLNRLVEYLKSDKGGRCVCDVLDRMYLGGFISFREMNELSEYILHYIDGRFIESEIEGLRLEKFIKILESDIKALQG